MSETRTDRSRPAFLSAILSGLSPTGPTPTEKPGARPRSDRAGSHAEDDDAGYETEDVAVGGTWLVVAGLAVTVALAVGGLGWTMHHFEAAQRAALPTLTGQQTARLSPPAPNLQVDAYADAGRHQAGQAALLSAYAYVDPGRRRARIPIERAMALTVGKPLDP